MFDYRRHLEGAVMFGYRHLEGAVMFGCHPGRHVRTFRRLEEPPQIVDDAAPRRDAERRPGHRALRDVAERRVEGVVRRQEERGRRVDAVGGVSGRRVPAPTELGETTTVFDDFCGVRRSL